MNLFWLFAVAVFTWTSAAMAKDANALWQKEWPNTDFSRHAIDFSEIQSGGPPKDGIPAVDKPQFMPIGETKNIPDTEPAIVFTHGGETKIYPLRIMTWHEIVNDTVGGLPVVVTYCPLCNAGIVFNARHNNQRLTFGTTGKLRRSDLVMYDRQTESWWQQFSGRAIVGTMTGQSLEMLPARMEAFGVVRYRKPNALVMMPPDGFIRAYGANPYVGYDTAARPFLFSGDLPPGINPMMRVVVVNDKAWTLPLLRKKGVIVFEDLELRWRAGQNSALDTRAISKGRDVGNVMVRRKSAQDGNMIDAVHHVTFAFVFYAFHPDATLFTD